MDAEAFKKQYLSFHPKLFRIAYALVNNKDDAEDIVQEAYIKLWNDRNRLKEILNAEAYSITLVKNLCLDFLRTPYKQRPCSDLETIEASTKQLLEKDLEHKNEVQIVKQLIERLPVNQRTVLKLHSIDECSINEIEKIMGLTAVNIRVLLSRARKVVREQFIKFSINE